MGKSTKLSDRGRARYFHGREGILKMFRETLTEAKEANGGTVFLVQAPPGAGKTALLHECKKIAKKWDVAQLRKKSFWDPNILRKNIGLEPEKRQVAGKMEGGVDKGLKIVGTRETVTDSSPMTTLDMLQAKNNPLLLVLDEAQELEIVQKLPAEKQIDVKDMLEYIHNGMLGRPVVLLAAGLGMTTRVFAELGLSRIKGESLFELGRLDKESELAVIRDWLKKDGGARKNLDTWMDAIVKETYGWPQHIMAYMKPAVRQLKQDGGNLTPEGLVSVLETGRKLREKYYARRAEGIKPKERRGFAEIFQHIPEGQRLEEDEIVKPLAKRFGKKRSKKIFLRALAKGFLYERDEHYGIPIPSMRDWLVENFPPKRQSSERKQ